MKQILFLAVLPLFLGSCSSTPDNTTDTSGSASTKVISSPLGNETNQGTSKPVPPPSEDPFPLVNEKGEIVTCTETYLDFFCKPSTDSLEHFRVILSSDSYQVLQIRGSQLLVREPDAGGDDLIKDELKKFDLLDFVDDGVIFIGLHPTTGRIETLRFGTRVPRINEIAKLIQSDASRWKLVHKHPEGVTLPLITKLHISYKIHLKKKSTREEIKEKFFKDPKKR